MALQLKNYDMEVSGVTDYKQGTSPWGSKKTSCGGTMAQEGCVITAFTNILNYKGKSVNPDSVLTTLKAKGQDCLFNWSGAASTYGITATRVDGNFNTVKTNLFNAVVKQKKAVLVHTQPHSFVVYGFVGQVSEDSATGAVTGLQTSMFKIKDPGSTTRTKMNQTLSAYNIDITKIFIY